MPFGRSLQQAASAAWRVLRSRAVVWATLVLIALSLLYTIRGSILRGVGAYLIAEDDPVHCDAIYVLGGASLERGQEAARLFGEGWSTTLVFTGEMIPTIFLAEGIDKTEAEVSLDAAVRYGAPPSLCHVLLKGTSTMDESVAILEHARASGTDTVMIVSSLFHLRRVRNVFRDKFQEHGIKVVLRGAPSVLFDEGEWWRKEEGLIMVNNEYVKLLYYWWKY